MLVILMGPTLAGKSELVRRLCSHAGFSALPSYTDRFRREDDTKDNIRRVDPAWFERHAAELAWVLSYTRHRYATRAADLELARGMDRVATLTFPGAVQATEFSRARRIPVRHFFLEPPSEWELRQRLRHRPEMRDDELARRMQEDQAIEQQARMSGLPIVFVPPLSPALTYDFVLQALEH